MTLTTKISKSPIKLFIIFLISMIFGFTIFASLKARAFSASDAPRFASLKARAFSASDAPSNILCALAKYDNVPITYVSPDAPTCIVTPAEAASGKCDPSATHINGLNPGYFPWISNTNSPTETTLIVSTANDQFIANLNELIMVCHTAITHGTFFSNSFSGTPYSPYSLTQYSTGKTVGSSLPIEVEYQIPGKGTITTEPPDDKGTQMGTQMGTLRIGSGQSFKLSIAGYTPNGSRFWQPQSGPIGLTGTLTSLPTQEEEAYVNIKEIPVATYTNKDGQTYSLCVNKDPQGSNSLLTATFPYGCTSSLVTLPITIVTSYDNSPSLAAANCSGQPQINTNDLTVSPGGAICFNVGMENTGETAGGTTVVELVGSSPADQLYTSGTNVCSSTWIQADQYLEPTIFDHQTAKSGCGYKDSPLSDTSLGTTNFNHYFWTRSKSPAYETSYYGVQYDNVQYSVRSSTKLGTQLCFVAGVTPANPNTGSSQTTRICYTVTSPNTSSSYDNVPSLTTCQGASTGGTVSPGSTICLDPGMENTGSAKYDASPDTLVELVGTKGGADAQKYATPASSNTNLCSSGWKRADSHLIMCGYHYTDVVGTSRKLLHYFWKRSEDPIGNKKDYNPINYNYVYYKISRSTPNGKLCFYAAVGPSTQNNPENSATTSNICFKVSSSSQPSPISTPCPLPGWLQKTNDSVSLTLPTSSPPSESPTPDGVSTSSAPSYSSSPDQTYEYAIPGDQKITSANDQYTPHPTSIKYSPNGYNVPNTSYTLNYANYNQYPYDDHITTVTYSQQFSVTNYESSSTPSYYQCDTYTSPIATCYDDTQSAEDANCSSGSVSAKDCVNPTCNSGYVDYYYKTDSGTINLVTSPSSTICYETYSGTPYYQYNIISGPTTMTVTKNTLTGGNSVEPYTLPEICPRNFTILPPSYTEVSQVSLGSGTKNPLLKQVNYPATVQTKTTIEFSLDHGDYPLRNPMSIAGINYTGDYYIATASGKALNPIGPTPDIKTFPTTPNTTITDTYGYSSSANDYNQYDQSIITQPFYLYQTSFTVPMPPLSVGDEICAQFSETPEQGEVNESGTISRLSSSGTQSSQAIPDSSYSDCSTPVSNRPYTRFYGNDVISGIQFSGSSLACDTSAGINANGGSGILPTGSGSQFAAMSLGEINNFATAFLLNGLLPPNAPTAPTGLTFANTSNSPTDGYGGNFGGSSTDCPTVYNYYANKPHGLNTFYGNNYSVNSNPNSIQVTPGSNGYVTLTSGTINNTHVIYVNGNVYIPSNIDYSSTSGSFDAQTGKVVSAPSLYVIALGNIYIGPGVTKLDGVYIAENTGDVNSVGSSGTSYSAANGGLINTCSDIPNGQGYADAFPDKSYTSGNGLFSKCDNQLVISGALIAHQVKLERTYASVRDGNSQENPLTPTTASCTLGNGSFIPTSPPPDNSECAAQVFNFNPENYLGSPNLGSGQKDNYDSILTLPPVF